MRTASVISVLRKNIKNINFSPLFFSFLQVKKSQYIHQENMSMYYIPPYTPPLYSKTGVYRGIPIFHIFDPKHSLWALVRIASYKSSSNNQCFEQKYKFIE